MNKIGPRFRMPLVLIGLSVILSARVRAEERPLQPIPEPNQLPISYGSVSHGTVFAGPPVVSGVPAGMYGAPIGTDGAPVSGEYVFTPPESAPGIVWLPSIHPVRRDPVYYQRYWPRRWYGTPGGGIAADAPRAPVIYLPTDTTQMGYYYQRTPQWQPRPGAIPTAAPNPFLLHNYTPPPRHPLHTMPAQQQGEIAPQQHPAPKPKQRIVPPAPDDLNKSANRFGPGRLFR